MNVRGVCSSIGMKNLFPTYIDENTRALPRVSVSAGVRGCQVILAVDTLAACVNARLAPLCRPVTGE